jgi:hypothetical protein
MVKTIFSTVCVFIFLACNNSAENHGKAVKTHADSLMDEVMENHNIGMAKMGKIREGKRKIQLVLDSIARLPTDLQKNSAEYKRQLDSAFNRLTFAGDAMDKWMEEFNMDSAANDDKMRTEYLQSEKIKISQVRDFMVSSLQKTDSLLRKNQ